MHNVQNLEHYNLSSDHTGKDACQLSHVKRRSDNVKYPGMNYQADEGLETMSCGG